MNQFVWLLMNISIFYNMQSICIEIEFRNTVQIAERKKKPREYIHIAMAVSVVPCEAYDVFDISLKCTCIEWTRQS